MSTSLTWIAICASILMGVGALLIFVLAVRRGWFRDLEEAKYQVFWSDIEELVESVRPTNDRPAQDPRHE
jgi:nitrogen fixation-related uncharacterized protein